jgi:hypothetical protein
MILLDKILDVSLTREQVMIVLVGVRRVISGVPEPPVRDIMQQTNVLDIIVQVFRMVDSNDKVNVRQMHVSSSHHMMMMLMIVCCVPIVGSSMDIDKFGLW